LRVDCDDMGYAAISAQRQCSSSLIRVSVSSHLGKTRALQASPARVRAVVGNERRRGLREAEQARSLVPWQELWREHHGVKTVARPPERQSSSSRSVPSELPCRDAVLLDLEVQSLVVGSEESRRCALIPPRGMKG